MVFMTVRLSRIAVEDVRLAPHYCDISRRSTEFEGAHAPLHQDRLAMYVLNAPSILILGRENSFPVRLSRIEIHEHEIAVATILALCEATQGSGNRLAVLGDNELMNVVSDQ